jgi:hypothetical protein
MTAVSVSADSPVALRAGERHEDDAKLSASSAGTSRRRAVCSRALAVRDPRRSATTRTASRFSHLSVAVPVMARAMRRADCRDVGRFNALVEA